LDGRTAVAEKKSTVRNPNADDILLVIFPRIYIVADNEPDPVTAGIVLMKSQSEAAFKEIETEDVSSPTTGKPGPRSRAIRSRTKSISLNSGRDL
jgi:hypothetical protein